MNMLQTKMDEDEMIEVDLVDIELCMDLIKTGKIRDNKTIVGVMIADLYASQDQ